MKNLGLLTTEFGLGLAVLIVGFKVADDVIAVAGTISTGGGIAIAGTMAAIAFMAAQYSEDRTAAKKDAPK